VKNSQTIIFFDGVCHLCNSFVDFLTRRDLKRRLLFAPLQGKTAAQYLSEPDRQSLETVIVWDRGQVFYRSQGLIQAVTRMGGIYLAFQVLRLIPTMFLDLAYDWLARHRYAWFGKRPTCRLATPEEKAFLLP
jgi:predicted DCC family thiol-disulfide oxidoreductase YuxK